MTLFNINLELLKKFKPSKSALAVMESIREVENKHTGKHELVDTAEAYKMVICKKSDAHDSKELAGFGSWLKNHNFSYTIDHYILFASTISIYGCRFMDLI